MLHCAHARRRLVNVAADCTTTRTLPYLNGGLLERVLSDPLEEDFVHRSIRIETLLDLAFHANQKEETTENSPDYRLIFGMPCSYRNP